jgi:hypothetical protein
MPAQPRSDTVLRVNGVVGQLVDRPFARIFRAHGDQRRRLMPGREALGAYLDRLSAI